LNENYKRNAKVSFVLVEGSSEFAKKLYMDENLAEGDLHILFKDTKFTQCPKKVNNNKFCV
jgi:hypothetical protein